ncbi:hypothetical protein [Jonesia quinghaiensis]|uniref:competence protein CoiA family protein n=1 Tax=Jonesia quinghaiensis TaxID=262806 RepID=UPI00146F33C8|nr:hypothetical protein [Jonesia quinghaiensis]
MSKSGLRFLAVRSGGCSHNLVEMRVDHGEVEQDPSNLVGGGGPEGDEHLWIKGRLLKIVQSLGVAAVLEHPLTRADVFLPDNNIALEYQRWDTNFQHRTAQRTSAGVETTIWLLPWQPTKAPRTKEHKSFNTQVFNHGGIYIAVLNKDNRYEVQRPWEDSSQERTARLYASGSIAVFDPSLGALVRKPRSLATVLSEIITGDRILANTFVLQKSDWRVVPALVWVLRDDLARVKSLLTEHRRDATPTTGKTSISVPNTERVTVPRHQPDSGSSAEAKTEEEQSPQLSVDVSTVENPNSMAGVALDSHSTTAHATFTPETRPTPHEVAPLASPHPITSRSKNPPRTPRRSMWKAITGWLGRM